MAAFRPAARVLCVNHEHCVLLFRWRDPGDGSYLWEPPGGGMEPGESPIDTARRELGEETGLPAASVLDDSVPVHREITWGGTHYAGVETFFLARFDHTPELSLADQESHEVDWFREYRWIHWAEIATLSDRVGPDDIPAVLAALAPDGPWHTR